MGDEDDVKLDKAKGGSFGESNLTET